MNLELIFTIANISVLPGWFLLIVAPRWRGTRIIINAAMIPLLLSVAYVVLLISTIGTTDGGFTSLSGVAKLFQSPNALLAGWIHYLVFDLFIGSWEVRDAQAIGLSHWLVIPCLVLTLWAGPAGLLLYFVFRWSVKRRFIVDR